MRKPTDPCLLCGKNPAAKTKSHIFPRFISTDFLGVKGDPRRGYPLSGETEPGKKPKTVQDSPKEDFILCEACERYFSILEGYSADTFVNWKEKVKSGKFDKQFINEDISVIHCKVSDSVIIRLFVYSVYWRASISSHDLFNQFKLVPILEESLRNALISVMSFKLEELVSSIGKTKIEVFPISILTAEKFKEGTANLLMAINSSNPAALHVDQFGFLLFHDMASIKVDFIREFSNVTDKDCKMMILGEQLWNTLMVQRPIQMIAEEVKQKAIKPKEKE